MKREITNENEQFLKNNIVKEEPKEIKSPKWWIDKNKFEKFLLLLTATNLITRIKYANLSMLTLKT